MAGEWDGGWWSSWWRGGGGGGNDGRWQDDGGRGCGDAKGDDNDVAWHGHDAVPAPPDVQAVSGQTSSQRGSGATRKLPHVVTVEYIQSVKSTHQKFMLNNVALKWIRDTHESPPGVPSVEYVNLNDYHTEGLQIGIIGRVTEWSQEYWWLTGSQPWSWLQMFKSMKPECIEAIIGDGITNIECAPDTRSYDHKRADAAKNLNKPFRKDAPVPVWDFFVTRKDGSTVSFHTNLADNKVSLWKNNKCYIAVGGVDDMVLEVSRRPGTNVTMEAQACSGPSTAAFTSNTSPPLATMLSSVVPAAPPAKQPSPEAPPPHVAHKAAPPGPPKKAPPTPPIDAPAAKKAPPTPAINPPPAMKALPTPAIDAPTGLPATKALPPIPQTYQPSSPPTRPTPIIVYDEMD
jgi:hypothetical protein